MRALPSAPVVVAALALASPVLGFVDLTGPLYQDQTPLCHYVERGIDDLRVVKRDVYAVLVPGVESLAQVDHLTLGLDLHYTRCKDDPRNHPCADEDVTTTWCVEKVELWVGDTKLFERAEPGAARSPSGTASTGCGRSRAPSSAPTRSGASRSRRCSSTCPTSSPAPSG